MRDWLKKLRKEKSYTTHDMAKLIGCTYQYYCMIENGSRRPSYEIAKIIAGVLDFDVILLMERVSSTA